MTAAAVGNWLYEWAWTNHGVGNFAAGAVVAVLAVPRLRRSWKGLRADIDLIHQHHRIGRHTPQGDNPT